MSKPVWFITGCSTGFGRELARHVLALGHPTVVTARDPHQVTDLAQGHDHALVLPLDVTDQAQIAASVREAEARFGRIDVLVNNAGIGYFGAFEDSDREAVRRMFEINVWGLVDMTRAVLPGMRSRRAGTIVNISSMGGLVAFPGVSFYHGTKFAVEGMSESLAQEVAPLGIRVLIVEPGPFRTDWAGRSAEEVAAPIPDYEPTAGARMRTIRGYSGKQPGDPVRAAHAIVQAVESGTALRLVLGKVALEAVRGKIENLRSEVEAGAATAVAADFDQAPAG
jgi:NAD(P)-dependent dehydrogenase (short-subunit alcohol dehydrogenase family)